MYGCNVPEWPNNEEFSDQILVHYIGFTVV